MRDNGKQPANPTNYQGSSNDELWCDNLGLTKRETMAMYAMQALLSNPVTTDIHYDGKRIASEAVDVADALLKELNK